MCCARSPSSHSSHCYIPSSATYCGNERRPTAIWAAAGNPTTSSRRRHRGQSARATAPLPAHQSSATSRSMSPRCPPLYRRPPRPGRAHRVSTKRQALMCQAVKVGGPRPGPVGLGWAKRRQEFTSRALPPATVPRSGAGPTWWTRSVATSASAIAFDCCGAQQSRGLRSGARSGEMCISFDYL